MNVRYWPGLPLAKLVLPYAAGILLFTRLPVPVPLLLPVGLLALLLLIGLHRFRPLAPPMAFVALSGILVLAVAGIRTNTPLPAADPSHFSHHSGKYLVGCLQTDPEPKPKSYKVILRASLLLDSLGNRTAVNGKLLLYLQRDSLSASLRTGDMVMLPSACQPVEGPKNPGQFDYRRYLSNKQIGWQAYVRSGQLKPLRTAAAFPLRRISQSVSKQIQALLYRYIPDKEAAAIADGILLGHRAEIGDELYDAFAHTGILHILSVSGLHVGIVYALLALFLRLIPDRRRWIVVLKFGVTVSAIWAFAFVAGLGAAVVRAALLFTLLHTGRLLREHTNSLNLLSGAALIQLLLDPWQLFDIGFQLSYMAMLGIFLVYTRLYSLLYVQNRLLNWTWQLWAMSLAAQLFTLPLSIYYFGNFPTWFLLANIFAIPLSTLILWLSILLLPLHLYPPVAVWAGKLLGEMIGLFTGLTRITMELPAARVSGLYIDEMQMVLLLVAVIAFSVFLLRTRYRALLLSLVLCLVVVVRSIQLTVRSWQQEEVVLYAVPGTLAVAWNSNDRQVLFERDTIPNDRYGFYIEGTHRPRHVRKISHCRLDDSLTADGMALHRKLLHIGRESFYFLDTTNSRLDFREPLPVDHLVICGNVYLDTGRLRSEFQFDRLYLATDNDGRRVRIYRKLLDKAGIAYTDLNKGAVRIPL